MATSYSNSRAEPCPERPAAADGPCAVGDTALADAHRVWLPCGSACSCFAPGWPSVSFA